MRVAVLEKHVPGAPVSILLLVALALAACEVPQDPYGTTREVRGGELAVGIIEGSPYASVDGVTPRGEEVELVNAIAREFAADLRWTHGTTAQVMTLLEHRKIDLAIGGIPASTPWKSHFAPTAAVGKMQLGGEVMNRIFALPKGENRWLFEVNQVIRGASRSP